MCVSVTIGLMPETCEGEMHVMTIKHAFQLVLDEGKVTNFPVIGLWADYTNTEALRMPRRSPAGLGYVDMIEPTSKLHRGQRSNQTPLYPPQLHQRYQHSHKKPTSTELLEGLVVQGPQSISGTDCSMVVDLGPIVLQVCLLLC
jgi:hypothetical protein